MLDLIIEENVDMKTLTTYRLKGKVKKVVYPTTTKSLIKLIKELKRTKEKYVVLGLGSNIIFGSDYYDGIVIKLTKLGSLEINGETITAPAGYSLMKLCEESISRSLSGLENLSGIPGTLGGAIYGNAGSFGSTISDVIEEVTVLSKNKIKTLKQKDLNFTYRSSIFKEKKDLIILSAKLNLKKESKEKLLNIKKELLEKRKSSQPLEYPNAGSVFKNPENAPAGKIIEDLNLKGTNIKDAYVSTKHANFIINKGDATGKDIIALIDLIKEKVKKETGITLSTEQIIIN